MLCCNRIQVGVKDLRKLSVFAFAIETLCSIYSAYCNKRINVSNPLCEVPDDVKQTNVKEIIEYFEWVIKVQNLILHWQELFTKEAYNYDDVLAYAGILATVERLMQLLNIAELAYEVDQIMKFKSDYYEKYAEFCSLVVRKTKDVDGYVIDMHALKALLHKNKEKFVILWLIRII